MMKIISTIVMCCGLTACASTKITGYSDPAYTSKQYPNVVVFASNFGLETASQLENSICSQFADNNIKCFEFHLMFPPTRSFSADNVFLTLNEKDISSILILSSGGGYSSSQVFAYQAYGSAYTHGGQTTASGMAFPISSYYRQSNMRLTLVDVATRATAWLGDAKTEGQGWVNVTDSAFISSIAREAATSLVQSPHFGFGLSKKN